MPPNFSIVTLILLALLMGTTFAHVLEMPSKMKANQTQWLDTQTSLYRYFAIIGGPLEIGALLCAAVVAYLLRAQRLPFLLSLSSTIALAVAFFFIWVFVTNPVNKRTALWWRNHKIPSDWQRWRAQWEYSHCMRFALHLFAFVGVLIAVLSGAAALDTGL